MVVSAGDTLCWEERIWGMTGKAKQMTPWIIRNIPFYKAFVRPHMGYTVQVWAPTAHKTRKLGYYNGNWKLPKTVLNQDNWGHGPTPLSSRDTASQINDFTGTTNAWWLNKDLTSYPPSGPRSWFKLAFATEREFVDVLCSMASGVNSPPLDVGFSCKWCESEESENFLACQVQTCRH